MGKSKTENALVSLIQLCRQVNQAIKYKNNEIGIDYEIRKLKEFLIFLRGFVISAASF